MAKVSKQELAYNEYLADENMNVQQLADKYSVAYRTMCVMLYRERKKRGTVIESKRH